MKSMNIVSQQMKISTFMGAPKDLNLIYVVERDIFYKYSTNILQIYLYFDGFLKFKIHFAAKM
jgi:hypothetical protein